jgi:hypothetical protein
MKRLFLLIALTFFVSGNYLHSMRPHVNVENGAGNQRERIIREQGCASSVESPVSCIVCRTDPPEVQICSNNHRLCRPCATHKEVSSCPFCREQIMVCKICLEVPDRKIVCVKGHVLCSTCLPIDTVHECRVCDGEIACRRCWDSPPGQVACNQGHRVCNNCAQDQSVAVCSTCNGDLVVDRADEDKEGGSRLLLGATALGVGLFVAGWVYRGSGGTFTPRIGL